MRDICVIGLGLIGGSVLRGAKRAGYVAWGASASTVDNHDAVSDGFDIETTVDSALRRAADRDAMVVLAVPLTAVENVLQQVKKHASDCLITDVTSVKGPVLAAVKRILPNSRYVGGHPMAGTTSSGWKASTADLFDDATWVVELDDATDLHEWLAVAQLALDLGAHVIPLSAEAHDEAVARISHLPHILAAVLAAVGAAGGPAAKALAAGSFASGTRVASSNPELVRAMTEGNGAALLPILDDALGRLGAARGSLASTGGLAATISAGHHSAQAFAISKNKLDEIKIDLAGEEARQGLQTLGQRGGRITSLDENLAHGYLPQS